MSTQSKKTLYHPKEYLNNERFRAPLLKPFPKNFVWGTATSSYQVEGATKVGGRSDSIWDVYARIPGRVYAGQNGDIGVDQYHRYKEDIALMKDLGITHYRFSVSWARVIPDGKLGKANTRGLDYYHRLTDELLRQGIKPALTLYHWDHPQVLEQEGGWVSRNMAYYFADYAGIVAEALKDKVDFWITLNEPWCSSILSYLLGIHAPGLRDRTKAYDVLHHLNLAHGLAVTRLRSLLKKSSQIGIACNFFTPAPASNLRADIEAADRAADRETRMFLNPILGKPYPERHLRAWNIKMPIKNGDEKIMSAPVDFMGINYYKEDVAVAVKSLGQMSKNHNPEGFLVRDRKGVDISDMGWPVVPEGIYRLLNFVHQEVMKTRKKPLPLYITENGYASPDEVQQGEVHDYARVAYLGEHMKVCQYALSEGIPLKGYFVWSFIDNYEWTLGYQKRFGIVHCDFKTLRRTPKASFYYYKKIIESSK